MALTDLKPCPFCGGKAEYVTVMVTQGGPPMGSNIYYNIRCESCKANAPGAVGGLFVFLNEKGKVKIEFDESERKAVEAWNRRAEP